MIKNDFLLSSYSQILELGLRQGYSFLGFDQIGQEQTPYTCLLRHDVDSELWSCLPMANIETRLGIPATYFVMMRSTVYNLFCLESLQTVEKLIKGGHNIGLHFMGELCENDSIEILSEKVLREVSLLEREFDITVPAVSFHQPTEKILKNDITIKGLINTYNQTQMKGYFYISDTNMIWKYESPAEIFRNHTYPHLQLLIHPIWWTERRLSLKDKWRHALDNNRQVVVEHWYARERTLEKGSLAVNAP